MPKSPFDLVILDLDGTILDLYRAEQISPVVQQTIAAVQAAGIPVTIGTGRTLDYVRTHFGFLGLTAPAVTTQGAVIGDLATGRVLAETAIPLAQAQQLAQWVDESAHVVVFYFNDEHGLSQLYQNRLGVTQYEIDFHDHVFGAPRTLQSSFASLLTEKHPHPPVKFICDNELSHGPDLAPILRQHFGDTLYITRTHPRLVEGTAPGVDKGTGVLRLCDLLSIDPQRVLAIGDNDNDIPMLATVGYGVAMGNASPGAKAVAQWIAPPIEEDGAAVALQRLVLGL
jgi:Cof subfamily protein (haloacid dehalogenase superfamily)